jgi:hypothetical protein
MAADRRAEDAPGRKAIIVAGMHRSGTSAMARVLSLSGGDMARLVIAAADDNPHGYWEPQEMVALNNEILAEMGSAWDDPFGYALDLRKAAAGFAEFLERAKSFVRSNYAEALMPIAKDPRASLLAPLWAEAFASGGYQPCFVIMVRSPLEVAESIAKRDGAPIAASMLTWLSNMMAVERDTRGMRRVFVAYDDLLADWQGVIDRISQRLEIGFSHSCAREIGTFVTTDARHHARSDADWTGRSDVWPGVVRAWEWFIAAARDAGEPSPFPHDVTDSFEALCRQMAPVRARDMDRASKENRALRSLIADREASALRLQAQVREYASAHEDVIADRLSADQRAQAALRELAEMSEQSRALSSKLSLSFETRRVAEQKIIGLEADMRASDQMRVRALEQAEELRVRCERGEQGLQKMAAEVESARAERDTLLTSIGEQQARLNGLESQKDRVEHQLWATQRDLEATRGRLEAVTSTRLWRSADVIRKILGRNGA